MDDSFNNLPDYLPGYPKMYGVKQELPQHYQGDRISLFVATQEDPKNYTLRAYLADSLEDGGIFWAGAQKNGVEAANGGVNVTIKSSISRYIPSGTYYLAVVGCGAHDVNTWNTLGQSLVSVTPAASSPYPIIMTARPFDVPTALNRPAPSVILPKVQLPWYEGTDDAPPSAPQYTSIPAVYSSPNGTFFKWDVARQAWIAIVGNQ